MSETEADARIICPKCSGSMAEGWIPVHIPPLHTPGNFFSSASRTVHPGWNAGPPKRNFFGYVKPPRDNPIPIATYRCASCGYLESYAK